MKKKCISVILISCFCLLALCYVNATENRGYYDREDEANNTTATADVLTSERVMQGQFPSTSDNFDYYKISVTSGNPVNIQLSSIPGGCDFDLFLLDSTGQQILSSTNGSDMGEWISYTSSTTGYYYIRVNRYSGTSSSYYRLYAQTTGQTFNQSFYITQANSDSFMTCLGRDHTNNIAGLVFLSFGEAELNGSIYGVNDLDEHSVSLSRVKTAVEKFIQGYNANPKHNKNIQLVVSINNNPSGEIYQLPSTTTAYYNHGKQFKNTISSISPSGYVTNISGGINIEMDYNTPELTKAWVDGFCETGSYMNLYNFGDHAGRFDDFSGEADPVFNNNWNASEIYYVSYGGHPCSFCIPEIYTEKMAYQWAYQKKWGALHNSNIYYSGVMSTNTWESGLITNQQSYTYFYNKLSTVGYGQSLIYKTWMSLPPPAQPN